MKMEHQYKLYQFQSQDIPREMFDGAMEELAEMFEKQIKDNLKKDYPYARGYKKVVPQTGIRNLTKKTGRLYNSVSVSYSPQRQQIFVDMIYYWKYVNDGRKPGDYVPLKPLMEWIKIKGLNRNQKGQFKKGSLKGLAARISKSIKDKGIEPTNFYDDAFDVFVEAFKAPDGPMEMLGLDLQTFIRKFLQKPTE